MARVTGGLFLSAVLLALLLGPPAAKADTFVFNDLSETPTISGLGPSPVACTAPPLHGEECSFHISPPAGATSVDFASSVLPVNAFGFGASIADPDGTTISDELEVGLTGSTEPLVLVSTSRRRPILELVAGHGRNP
jgi:hypothetical protein